MAKKKSSGKKNKSAEEKDVRSEKEEDNVPEAKEEKPSPEKKKSKKSSKSSKKKEKTVENPPEAVEEKEEEAVKNKPSRKKKKGKKSKKSSEMPAKEEKVSEETVSEGLTAEDAKEPEKAPEDEKTPKEEKTKDKAIEEEDEYAITLLGWATAGYDTSKLEDSLSRGDMKAFKKDYKRFEKGIIRIEEIKREIESLNIAGVEKEVDDLLQVLKDPLHTKKAENYLERLKKLIHAKDLEVELESMMSVESLKSRALSLKDDLKDPDNIDDVEEQMKDMRREFKEEYALNQFMELIDEKPREVKKIKVVEEVRKTANPMMVKDLFVFTSTGKFMGHKTARKGAIDKKNLIEKLNSARDIIRNDKISPGMSVKIPRGDEILLVHKGARISVGMIISGQPHKLAGQLLKKGVEMMEREDADIIKKWDSKSKKPTLPHMKKNMNAIMYAAMKLGDEMRK